MNEYISKNFKLDFKIFLIDPIFKKLQKNTKQMQTTRWHHTDISVGNQILTLSLQCMSNHAH